MTILALLISLAALLLLKQGTQAQPFPEAIAVPVPLMRPIVAADAGRAPWEGAFLGGVAGLGAATWLAFSADARDVPSGRSAAALAVPLVLVGAGVGLYLSRRDRRAGQRRIGAAAVSIHRPHDRSANHFAERLFR